MEKRLAIPCPAPLSAGLRRYLYFTAALTGASIMIVEILGAKMLAPYVGTSHFVWTAQIAITLVALATGYYVGGLLVDRSPRLGRLYWAILGAAIYLGVTVLVVEPVAYRCLNFKLALGSLLASAFLFFVPLALLAMVGPFFVRMLTFSVTGVGGNVGRLTAVSTLGSFLGTVLIGYVLVPYFPNSVTMYATSSVLLLATAGYFAVWERKKVSVALVSIAVLFGLLPGGIGVAMDRPGTGEGWREIYRANSNFGRLQVIDAQNGACRYFLNDLLPQNAYDPATQKSVFMFSDVLHSLARGYAPEFNDVLVIGLGVGIVPMKFVRDGARVEAVEINPAIVPIAKKYFDLDPARLNIAIDDGRDFVNRCAKKYDVIILDAFLGDSAPAHLMSRESFASIRGLLKTNGVLVVDNWGENIVSRDFLVASLDKTLKAVFRNVRIHASGNGNVFFVASDQAELQLRNPPDLSIMHEMCRHEVGDAIANILTTNPRHGIILTDDFNPVEYYDAANREQFRRQLALSIRPR
jgi:spermidine synthase